MLRKLWHAYLLSFAGLVGAGIGLFFGIATTILIPLLFPVLVAYPVAGLISGVFLAHRRLNPRSDHEDHDIKTVRPVLRPVRS